MVQDDGLFTRRYYAQAWALITFLRHGAGGRYGGAFCTLLNDIADGKYRARVSAARLIQEDGRHLSDDEAVFRAYFDCAPESLVEQYYDHVVRVVDY
jgi:hypothetical protein